MSEHNPNTKKSWLLSRPVIYFGSVILFSVLSNILLLVSLRHHSVEPDRTTTRLGLALSGSKRSRRNIRATKAADLQGEWPRLFPNATDPPYTEYAPRWNVIWSRGWYNAVPPSVPLGYYNQKRQGTLFKLYDHEQAKLWNPKTLCGNQTSSGGGAVASVSLWIRSADLRNFIKFYQVHETEFRTWCGVAGLTIINSDGDDDIPDRISKWASVLLDSPIVKHWYAQNLVQTHPKWIPIPLGLDLHSYQGLPINVPSTSWSVFQTMARIRRAAFPLLQRNRTILVDVGVQTQCTRRKEIRGNLHRAVTACPVWTMSKRGRVAAWETYSQHIFAVAPPGCGWDTHRLWEYLFFGTIPIVLSTELDRLLLPAHVPVVVVDSWSEICTLAHNTTLFDRVLRRYHTWMTLAHEWLKPGLWIPRNQARMDALCGKISACLEAASMGHRMEPLSMLLLSNHSFACPSKPNPESQRRCRSLERTIPT